jgi:rod shape-determining protein MreB
VWRCLPTAKIGYDPEDGHAVADHYLEPRIGSSAHREEALDLAGKQGERNGSVCSSEGGPVKTVTSNQGRGDDRQYGLASPFNPSPRKIISVGDFVFYNNSVILDNTMFDRFFSFWSKDIGIDLGTANTLVYVHGKGIILNEPSIVAINQKTGQILAIGQEARKMVGRTPGYIVVSRPLVAGVVSDFEVTEQMLKYFIDRSREKSFSLIPRPRVVIGIPAGVTEVERRAVEDAAYNAGAREVFLIEEPMAAAIGARLPVQEAAANLIVDIGGGTTDVAVISMGGVVASRSLRVAGDKLTADISQFMREEHNVLIGDATAENIKIGIGSAYPLNEELTLQVRGRDILTGLPKELTINSEEVRKAMHRSIKSIVLAIKNTIEETPPELIADLLNRSIFLAGGGGLLRGFDELISHETKLPVKIVDDPMTCVVRGCGMVLEHLDSLKQVLVWTAKEAYL